MSKSNSSSFGLLEMEALKLVKVKHGVSKILCNTSYNIESDKRRFKSYYYYYYYTVI